MQIEKKAIDAELLNIESFESRALTLQPEVIRGFNAFKSVERYNQISGLDSLKPSSMTSYASAASFAKNLDLALNREIALIPVTRIDPVEVTASQNIKKLLHEHKGLRRNLDRIRASRDRLAGEVFSHQQDLIQDLKKMDSEVEKLRKTKELLTVEAAEIRKQLNIEADKIIEEIEGKAKKTDGMLNLLDDLRLLKNTNLEDLTPSRTLSFQHSFQSHMFDVADEFTPNSKFTSLLGELHGVSSELDNSDEVSKLKLEIEANEKQITELKRRVSGVGMYVQSQGSLIERVRLIYNVSLSCCNP